MESSYRVNIMHELQIKTKSLETISTHVSLDQMVLWPLFAAPSLLRRPSR